MTLRERAADQITFITGLIAGAIIGGYGWSWNHVIPVLVYIIPMLVVGSVARAAIVAEKPRRTI